MTKVTSTIDLSGVLEKINAGSVKGLRLASEHVLTEANKHVPHDEGTLERSGDASVDPEAKRAAVSYDTPYAVKQHEDMSLHHHGKGKAKWLEAAFSGESATVGQIIATATRGEVES